MEDIEFTGSRKSQAATTRKILWIGLAAGFLFGLVRTGFSAFLLVTWGIVLALFGLLDWAFLRRQAAGRSVALLDEGGIASPLFSTKAKRFAWNEIASASLVQPQGHRTLQLELKPRPGLRDRRAFWTGINHARPQIPLASLDA